MHDQDDLQLEKTLPLSTNEQTLLAHERTRLASERTLLSWIRTGLTSIGIGAAIAHLLIFQHIEHQRIAVWVGQLLVLWGIIIFIFALFSYRQSYKKLALREGYRSSLIGVTLIVGMLIILSMILLRILV